MRNLVYRVHQLPESLIDLVSDFGAISTQTEALYIKSILKRELENTESAEWFDQFLEMFSTLNLESQEYTREVNNNERSVVSLRDIARTTRVFKWFLDNWNIFFSDPNDRFKVTTILTLGYCYNSRLNRQNRSGYWKRLTTNKDAKVHESLSWFS